MNHQEKIIDFRQQALYYTTEAKRFKILIETVTGCYGSCLGCAFTENERMNFTPLIAQEDLARMFERLTELLDYNSDQSIVSEYDTTVINFGGSEHFIYGNEYLGELFSQTSQFFHNVKTDRNVLAFSSSGLLNIDKMEKRSMNMLQALDQDQFVVDMVIDLNRFDKLKERYQESFDFFQKNFGFLDLAINIESFIDTRDWQAFCEFVDQNGILNVDLIYALNKNNIHRVPIESQKIFDIYQNIVKNTKQGKGLFDLHNLLRVKSQSHYDDIENQPLHDICREAAKNILKDAIFIDGKFDVYPVLFVLFADVPLNDRTHYPKIANLFDEDFKEKYQNYYSILYRQLMKEFAKSPQCLECPIVNACYQTGAPLINQFLTHFNGQKVTTFEQCQNPVKNFIIARNENNLILHEDEIS